MQSQNNQPMNQGVRQSPPEARRPIVNKRKIGRNEKVTIRRGDEKKIIKWKKAQDLIQSGELTLEE